MAAALLTWASARCLVSSARSGSDQGQTQVRPRSDPYGSASLPDAATLPIYARWSKTRMANVVRRSEDPSRRDHPRPDQARSARHLHQGRHRVHLRQQVEAAVLHQGGRRLLPARRAMGRHPQAMVALLRRGQHRLVGAEVSGRQREASDRPALRRLPLGRTTTSRPGRSPNGTSAARNATARAASTPRGRRATNIFNPAARGSGPRQRHLHPVPLAGTAAHQSDRRPLLRLAGRLPRRPEPERFLELEEHEPGKTTFTHFADGTAHKNRMQGNDFVQSLMYTRGVTCASCHDVHGTANNADLRQAGRDRLPAVPRRRLAERAAHQDHRAAHPPQGRSRRATSAWRATCRRSRRRSAT